MRKLFPAARLALLLAVAWCLSLVYPMYGASTGWLLGVATFSFILFESLSGMVAYRRLCYRLGAIHEIWANADRFQSLRYLRWTPFPSWALDFFWKPSYVLIVVRGFFGSLRGWWMLQCIYEVFLASLVMVAMTYLLLPDRFEWSSLPLGLVAVAVLASKRAVTIYDPVRFCPEV